MSNVENRPNGVAKGFTKHYERNERLGKVRITNPCHSDYDEKELDITSLIVRGTCDECGSLRNILIKKAKIPHPTDVGYYKEAYVLSQLGKNYYRRTKKRLQHEINKI